MTGCGSRLRGDMSAIPAVVELIADRLGAPIISRDRGAGTMEHPVQPATFAAPARQPGRASRDGGMRRHRLVDQGRQTRWTRSCQPCAILSSVWTAASVRSDADR
jgi:hypothetical protein